MTRRAQLRRDEPAVRIAHLADLHLTSSDAERSEFVRQKLARPEVRVADIVAVAGDITDRATESDFGEAADVLATDRSWSREITTTAALRPSGIP